MGCSFILLQVASALRERDKFHQCSKNKLIVACNVDNIASPKEDIGHLIADMQSTGADILKLVVNATNITETAKVFQVLSHSQVGYHIKVSNI